MPPRILALETSGLAGGVALLDGGVLSADRTLAVGQRSAQSLAPAIADLLASAAVFPHQIELVAVTIGPGSFTGLRVGVATAKMFAYAIGAAVVGIDTLDVLARQAPLEGRRLWTLIDAHRGELFAATFARSAEGWRRDGPNQILSREEWLVRLETGDLATGPVVARIRSELPAGVAAVDALRSTPQASVVGLLGYEAFCTGHRDDPAALTPNYGRLSAAEEKRATAHRTPG